MEQVLIFYSEIGLKGKNKKEFENKLKSNIKLDSKKNNLDLEVIKIKGNQFFCIFNNTKDEIKNILSKIFGIKSFSFVEELGKDYDKFMNRINELILEFKDKGIKELNIKTKRGDKQFPKTSVEINTIIGEICRNNNIKINYKSTENILYIKISLKNIYIYYEKILGLDGLPTGTSGRVLVLLSGGIDSPVAAYKMLKRGVTCDFLHFHSFKENKEVLNTKIIDTIKIINQYQNNKSTLYTIPHYLFDFIINDNLYEIYNLILFKHYILKMAELVAKKYDYMAFVTGDALAQVASQTLDNINVTSNNINIQIFRPLISYDKEEIVSIARKIETFEISTQVYKDCCSLVAKNPITKAKLDKFEKSIKNINLNDLFEKSLDKLEYFKIE